MQTIPSYLSQNLKRKVKAASIAHLAARSQSQFVVKDSVDSTRVQSTKPVLAKHNNKFEKRLTEPSQSKINY